MTLLAGIVMAAGLVVLSSSSRSSSALFERDSEGILLASPPTTKCRSSSVGPSVAAGVPGVASYCDFPDSIKVTFDARSIKLNGAATLFISGSIHGPRGTPATWATALDDAVANGLNMIQVYAFWNFHERVEGRVDWEGEAGSGRLGDLISMCGDRGLFVTLRVGPYVCAEWDYGGLPVWVGLKEGVALRRYNGPWMDAMAKWVATVIDYASERNLWAHQGGPIVMAQIENELDASEDPRGPEYVEWCGDLANSLMPHVPWLMCNGDTANSTINTCNGYGGTSCATAFLESNGQSGRILVDQPALWTENEGGYQLWGESSEAPVDYFWGVTAAQLAYETMQWFARGGAHVNYYMWWGGYNRGSTAAAGITNAYAVDAPLCPNGARHQPKFDHLTAMHTALAQVASFILAHDAQYRNASGSPQVKVFQYGPARFLESNESVSLYLDGELLFDSAAIADSAASYARQDTRLPQLHWRTSSEKIGSDQQGSSAPVEQSVLTLGLETQYAWYETTFVGGFDSLSVDTDHSNGLVVFVDGAFAASAEDASHKDGPITLTMPLLVAEGNHTLSILSESFGYNNLIGRWGGSTAAKKKGITGRVMLRSMDNATMDLTDGRHEWRSSAGLNGPAPDSKGPKYHVATFTMPDLEEEALMFDASGLSRGHVSLNGHDLGRFWNVTRRGTSRPTQRYYHLPPDMLLENNTLTIFDVFGAPPTKTALLKSALAKSPKPRLPDVVDSPLSCLG